MRLFIESANFDELEASIVNVSHAIAATVPTLTSVRENCEKAPWLGFLALLLPLLAVLVAPLCGNYKSLIENHGILVFLLCDWTKIFASFFY